jgi:two-component system chemotaxis response regulator CheB
MESAAAACGADVVGILLTGMGSDGALGLKAIKEAGGATLAEDASTCLVFGMPRAALALGCVDRVVPLPQIARALLQLL